MIIMAKDNNEIHSGFAQEVCSSVDSTISLLQSSEKITLNMVYIPEKLKKLEASEIVQIREKHLNVSQTVFAKVLNVSLKTVQAWEQNLYGPAGISLRVLRWIEECPKMKEVVLGNLSRR